MASKDQLEKCICALTAAKTDTERFAALLIVTRAIRSESCDLESRLRLFDAVGFDFVLRLLLTKDIPEGCHPRIFANLATTLLAAFCTVPKLVTDGRMVAQIPIFVEILFESEENSEKSDALACIFAISSTSEGCEALIEIGVVSRLCSLFSDDRLNPDFLELVFRTIVNVIVASKGTRCWQQRHLQSFNLLMNTLSRRFVAEERTQRKFDRCDDVSKVMWSFPIDLKDSCRTEPWYRVFHDELMGILCFKLGEAQREPLFKLCAVFVEKLEVRWALGDTEQSYRLFLLLVQLCCVEIRMILEDQTYEDVMSKSELLSGCFIVAEHAIHFLVGDGRHVVTESAQQQLYQALTSAFVAILSFISSFTTKLEAILEEEPDNRQWQLVTATVRVMGAWLAEETAAVHDEVHAVLPFLVRAAYEERRRHGTTVSLYFLLPGLCHLSVEDAPRAVMLERNVPEILTEYMSELWQIVCKDIDENEYETTSEEGAVTLCCGTLMNIVVLEADNVSNYPAFLQLLKFVFHALPTVDRRSHQLVLRGNLSILGLLLLRRHASKFMANESSIYRFLSASIRFLWDAFGVEEESSVDSCLGVTLSYRAVWDQLKELWFIGMQALSSLLPAMPWVGQFIVESGWAEEMVMALGKVRANGVESNVCREYEGFLCCLVRSCDVARVLLQELGTTRMCATHRMSDLNKLLRGSTKSVQCQN